MRSALAVSQCLAAIAFLPFTTATTLNGLQARRYTNGTNNNTTIAPKVFLIDMACLLLRSSETPLTPTAVPTRRSGVVWHSRVQRA